MKRALVLGIALVASLGGAAAQQLEDVSSLQLPGAPVAVQVEPSLLRARGEVQVVVRLVDPPLAMALRRDPTQPGSQLSPGQQRAYANGLNRKQEALLAQIADLGGRELGRVSKALNAVMVAIDASKLPAIAGLPNVLGIRPVVDYQLFQGDPQLNLGDTVPYIGAAAVQLAGFDGTGVRVGVLDSGIDYTHANFGGPGTAAAYEAAYGTSIDDPRNKSRNGLFPTSKVVDGFDFVGERWPTPDPACGLHPVTMQPLVCLQPDPDPIDCGPGVIPSPCAGGHGSHVADITGGNDGSSHKGVAPGASLVAVKVCSAVATSCSGVALLQDMDFALDPNGDGDISDAVDVINMSLGASYGQFQDDLSEASANAARAGVVVVAAAGNSADRPYIVASPSSAPEVISVAQTQVPSANLNLMTVLSPAAIAGDYVAVFQPWSAPLASIITAPVQYGDGAGGNLLGCNPFPAGSLSGMIVLVDRGVCFFSDKIRNIENGGGLVGVIGLVAAGEPFAGGFGGGPPITIPGFMISQADANLIKAQLGVGVTARFDPSNVLALVQSMVATSSRGPDHSFNAIKPNIGAPGASLSAQAGTGTGQTPFGGTSGATPMVAGSAALLLHANPSRTPKEIGALLVSTAERNIEINPATQPGVLAPITRIGGGEVRVGDAFESTTAAWDADDGTPGLSFSYNALTGSPTFRKKVLVRNFSGSPRTYSITPSFRYADDAASGAVVLSAPGSIRVPPNGSATFRVQLKTDASKLPVWTLNGGSRGGDGFRLQGVEFDGYIEIADSDDTIHLPWQILPHRAAEVTPQSNTVALSGGAGSLVLNHTGGTVNGRVDVFAHTGTSGRFPPAFLPGAGDNLAVTDLKSVGVRLVNSGLGPALQFAINTFGARSHPNYPAEFDIVLDVDMDGIDDYVIANLENGGFAATGQNVVAVFRLVPPFPGIAFFFTDADLDSGNAILTAPLSAFGGFLAGPSLAAGAQFRFSVLAFDNYFTGFLTDAIPNMLFTSNTPRFVGTGIPSSGVPVGGSSTLNIQAVPGGDAASPSQTGLLLMYRDARTQREADAITVIP